jgi:hypothetical protein
MKKRKKMNSASKQKKLYPFSYQMPDLHTVPCLPGTALHGLCIGLDYTGILVLPPFPSVPATWGKKIEVAEGHSWCTDTGITTLVSLVKDEEGYPLLSCVRQGSPPPEVTREDEEAANALFSFLEQEQALFLLIKPAYSKKAWYQIEGKLLKVWFVWKSQHNSMVIPAFQRSWQMWKDNHWQPRVCRLDTLLTQNFLQSVQG